MKHLLLLIGAIALCCSATAEEKSGVMRYQAYRGAEDNPVLKTLEAVTLQDVNIRDKVLEEAIRVINQTKTNEGKRPVINVVIRYPKTKDGRPGQQQKARWVAILVVKEINFASAVDILCEQVGYKWSIEKNEKSSAPFLVLSP